MMMNSLKATLSVVLASVAVANAHAQSPSSGLNQLFDDYFERSLQLNPLQATFLGDRRYDDRLANDLSDRHRAEALASDRRFLATARDFSEQRLSDAERLSLDVLIDNLRRSVDGAEFPSQLLPINQLSSLPALLPMLASGTSAQPFKTTQDYENFLKRMRDYVTWSEQAVANMRAGLRTNVTYPRILMEKMLPQLQASIAEDPRQSVFYGVVTRFPDTVPMADRQRLESEYRLFIREELTPAYQRLHDFIRDEYLPRARSHVGWSALPNGAAWYAHLAKVSTTTTLTPDEIHELGLREVARIRGEMQQVQAQVAFKGDLHAFFNFLQSDPRFYYEDETSLLQGYEVLRQRIGAELPSLFSYTPKASYEVRAVETFRARSAPAASYQPGSPDGSRPGILYINTFNLRAQPKFAMETLSLHEAAPGHHFQVSIQQELRTLPRFRRFGSSYVAYQEGWAMYCESLGRELGLFADPYQYYGRLSYEMLRAMRLVVDTGLHTRNWTRERAIEYLLDNSSMAASDAEAEVDRYLAIPGQALGYKVGQLRFQQLRAKAQAALGTDFDVRKFHHELLSDGALPLDVLEGKIDRWIGRHSK